MTISTHLNNDRERMPLWLERHERGNRLDIKLIFDGRTVYYPGAGFDGQPVQLFASTHFAHLFVYVDYGVSRVEVEAQLVDPERGFRGYQLLESFPLGANDLTTAGWTPHLSPEEVGKNPYGFSRIEPYAFLQIFERQDDYPEAHGPGLIAIVFVGGDGIATYDALYCQGNGRSAPAAMVIQDHGYGGNYARFDHGGLLHKLAVRTGKFPEYLLVADNSRAWDGYVCVESDDVVYGGYHGVARRLFRKGAG